METNILIGFTIGDNAHPVMRLVGWYFPHLLLFFMMIMSGYIGYKLIVASGANPSNPIPPGNYRLLAPIIYEGRADTMEQYVRLASLSGATGTFTKLGLTGLPLTTVSLTLIFAVLALFGDDPEARKSMLDLAKLTLGAFIGSFVQRQVDQRRSQGEINRDDQSRTLQTSN